MSEHTPGKAAKDIWAYAYELVPPHGEDKLRTFKAILKREHEAAERNNRTWVASVVVERMVTHILVLSDSPEQDLEINHRLEKKLRELNAEFTLTAPLRVADEKPPAQSAPARPAPGVPAPPP